MTRFEEPQCEPGKEKGKVSGAAGRSGEVLEHFVWRRREEKRGREDRTEEKRGEDRREERREQKRREERRGQNRREEKRMLTNMSTGVCCAAWC